MELVFKIVAVILVGIAAFFYWQGNTDGMFVSLVLAVCAGFLNYRFQAKSDLKDEE